jgi:hypothetical protein
MGSTRGPNYHPPQANPNSWPSSDAGSPPSSTVSPVKPVPLAPTVPKYSSEAGTTVVDVPALQIYASNIGQLIGPVEDALTQLKNLEPVAPGAFYHAYQILTKVDGTNGTGGLVPSYSQVLTDLANGLTDIQNAANQMAAKYKTFDDLNKMQVTDLQNDLNTAESDFNALMSANGGQPVTFNAPATPPSS